MKPVRFRNLLKSCRMAQSNRTCTFSPTAVGIAYGLLVSLLSVTFFPTQCAVGQMLSVQRTASDDRDLEVPPQSVAAKEKQFIREVLEPELILRVDTVKSKIIRTNYPVARVAISDPSVVDINEFDSMEIEVVGKKVGETTFTMWFLDEHQESHVLRYLVQVNASTSQLRSNMAELQDQINEMFPNSQITLTPLRDKLIVRGQVRDSYEADKILSLLRAQTANQGSSFSSGGLQGNASAGSGGNAAFAGAGNQGAGNQGGGVGGGGQSSNDFQLINLLRVPGEHQVMLKVRVAELSRYSSRDIGADLRGILGSISLGHLAGGIDDYTAILDGDDLRFFIRAVTGTGYGKILAEPTLVTISGKPASFLAGGEFAVPTAVGIDGIGSSSTSFRGFGTELEFTPSVIDKDLIRLQVNPSFSSLNDSASVNGIPGLNRRTVNTTVDLREGQWLAIAGLIQNQQGGNRSKLPYLGKLPVVGGLFGRQDTSREETELIVLVSPQLIHPMDSEDVPLLLPGMEVTDPTDVDFFHRHMIEGFEGYHHRSTTHMEEEVQNRAFQQATRPGLFENCGRKQTQGSACDASISIQDEYVIGPSGFSE